MNAQIQIAKFSTREIVAIVASVLIILAGLTYWLNEVFAVIDFLQLAYEYSVGSILGRFLLIVLGVSILIAIATFLQRKFN